MRVLINELSFIGQAKTIYDVPNLMRELMGVIRALEPIRGREPILTHSSFSSRHLAPNYTVHKWASAKTPSPKDIRQFIIVLATKGPFIDTILNNLDRLQCVFNQQDVSTNSIAGAAYFSGYLVSLKDAPEFLAERIQVKFGLDGKPHQDLEIINLTEANQVSKLRRRYVVSPKHARGGWGTLMDLEDEIAQAILDGGIMSGKHVFGCYSGKFYQFQPDNAGGYHGYPISHHDVPAEVLKKLQDIWNVFIANTPSPT